MTKAETSADETERHPIVASPARDAGVIARRASRWRVSTFGPASEEPYRRRVVDRLRLVVAAGLLALLVLHASYPSAVERDVFALFNDLPAGWYPLFRALYAAGTLWAVLLAVAAAGVARRWRLARDLVVAGGLAWCIARVLGAWVAGEGLSASFRAATRISSETPHFPLVRMAVLVAVAATAGPYLTRPTRRVGRLLVVVVALSALYLGTGLPDDIIGGIVLGLGVAAAVHLCFGSPGGRPTTAQVTAALAELGLNAAGIRLAPQQPHGSTLMIGSDDGGPISVRVIGRDEADGQFFAKLWRVLAYKDSGPTVYMTRLQQVEHQAYVTLLARDAGVRTSEVVVAGQAGPQTAVLVERDATGDVLAELDSSDVTDEMLTTLWQQVGLLHGRARVAHRALDAQHVVVDGSTPGIVDFGEAVSVSPTRASVDVVDLLLSTALLVGEDRAVTQAAEGIGTDALRNALPYMQPAVLSARRRVRTGYRAVRSRLDRLRTLVAEAAGVDPPRLQELHRVSPTSLLMAVGTLIGVAALLSNVGSPGQLWSAVRSADWHWAVVAFALSMATNVTFAVGLMGTVPVRLPLAAATEVQVSMSFANLAIPAVGGTASQVRFLQKEGVDLASAVAAGGLLSNAANVVVSIAMLALAVALSPHAFRTNSIPVGGVVRTMLVVVLVAGIAMMVVRAVPRLRRAVVPPIRRAMTTLAAAWRSPRQITLLVAGSVATNVLYGYCLLVCLLAFDARLSFWTLLALSIAFSTLASLIPVPGGGTAVSSVGMSGALTGFGVPAVAAVAAVLLNQLVVTYLPAVPGWIATEDLIRRDYL